MGTPEFAVPSLKILIENGFNVVGVITAPDRPAGRGRKIQYSAVKTFALSQKLTILQPTNLKDSEFIKELKKLNPDLQIVVAFRMLPEIVWNLPKLGTFNLHASLLPQYRGAAPINWAIINGERQTGVTTFFLDKEIDTGKIILQIKVEIDEKVNAGVIHDKLMQVGSKLVLETTQLIASGEIDTVDQDEYYNSSESLKKAPKIHKVDCQINWDNSVSEINDFVRGLSPYPGAYTSLISPEGKEYIIKVFKAGIADDSSRKSAGKIDTNEKNYLHVFTSKGILKIEEIQATGKQRMSISDFLRGFQITNQWKFIH